MIVLAVQGFSDNITEQTVVTKKRKRKYNDTKKYAQPEPGDLMVQLNNNKK